VSDVLWQDVEPFFDPELNGRLPDVCVPSTTVADWQKLLDLVRSRGWGYEYAEGMQELPAPFSAADFLARYEAGAVLRVRPMPQILAIFHPYDAEQIDFDIDLWELQGQERLDALCGFMRAIGRTLGKPVLMTWEGASNAGRPFLGYRVESDRVVLLADPAQPWAAPVPW
jgi:hypothetical protein